LVHASICVPASLDPYLVDLIIHGTVLMFTYGWKGMNTIALISLFICKFGEAAPFIDIFALMV